MATALFKPYGNFPAKLANKEIDLDSDSLAVTLHTATYTPNLDTHAYVSDLTNEVAAGAGYSTGGVTLTSLSRSYVAANSWAATAAIPTAASAKWELLFTYYAADSKWRCVAIVRGF